MSSFVQVVISQNELKLLGSVENIYIADEQLNNDLKIISEWAYQWKMQFNPDKTKQTVQVISSCKRGLSQPSSTLL